MNNTWFTSDTHFSHKNILEYEKNARPFTNITAHDEALIAAWNDVVRSNDTVYHLGDFCFGRSNIEIAKRLNGQKKLVMGNHDIYPSADYLKYFKNLYSTVYYKDFVLSHVPIHPASLRGKINVHGHLHSNVVMTQTFFPKRDKRYICVSVEQNNLRPIHIDEIRKRIK